LTKPRDFCESYHTTQRYASGASFNENANTNAELVDAARARVAELAGDETG